MKIKIAAFSLLVLVLTCLVTINVMKRRGYVKPSIITVENFQKNIQEALLKENLTPEDQKNLDQAITDVLQSEVTDKGLFMLSLNGKTPFLVGMTGKRFAGELQDMIVSKMANMRFNKAEQPLAKYTPPPLTAEQKKHNKKVIDATDAIRMAHVTGANKNLPKWVADHYTKFESRDYTKNKAAFQRSFGWGMGVSSGKQFYWFAHTNTDAWLQFDFSTVLPDDAMVKILLMKDNYGHPGEAIFLTEEQANNGWYIPGTVTWFGINNDWTDSHCTNDFQTCDIGSALDDAVARLNKTLPYLELETKGKFPW